MSNVFPQVQFFKCNTREDGPDLVSDMHGIRALPTFVFYKGKKEIKQARFEGANMDRLRGVIEKYAQEKIENFQTRQKILFDLVKLNLTQIHTFWS